MRLLRQTVGHVLDGITVLYVSGDGVGRSGEEGLYEDTPTDDEQADTADDEDALAVRDIHARDALTDFFPIEPGEQGASPAGHGWDPLAYADEGITHIFSHTKPPSH